MGKGRFTALDVSAMVTSLKQLIINLRISNIYDINSRTYLFKLSGNDCRQFLIIESGIRFHCTSYNKHNQHNNNNNNDNSMPNHFASKLRKYLKSKKITNIKQIGNDRIVKITFGQQEEYKFYLIIELFSGGNIILTDYKYNIIISLRIHSNNQYIFNNDNDNDNNNNDNKEQDIKIKLKKSVIDLIRDKKNNKNNDLDLSNLSNRQKRKQRRMNQKIVNIGQFITKIISVSPTILNAMTKKFNIDKNESLLNYIKEPYPTFNHNENDNESSSDESSNDDQEQEQEQEQEEEIDTETIILNEEKFEKLMKLFIQFEKLINSLKTDVCAGYIVSKKINLLPSKKINIFIKKKRRKMVKPTIKLYEEQEEEEQEEDEEEEEEEEKIEENKKFVYDEFVPFEIMNDNLDSNIKIDKFSTFNVAVDEFFSSSESIKNEEKQSRTEMLAFKKMESATKQHENRIFELIKKANLNNLYASIIEENLDLIDRAINGVNTLLSQGIDWNDLGNRIREEASFGNPIAKIINSLKLHEGIIQLKLLNNNNNKNINIDIELRLSAWNNAKKYYLLKKQFIDKKNKTLIATQKAIKAAQQKQKESLKKIDKIETIYKRRKIYWFEKFYWFISSQGFLIIAGRDAQQNELIVKKYMDKNNDLYVHASIHGASSVIIKNPKNIQYKYIINTINEAATFCICRSKAWNNNISCESYWVYAKQVSKTPPTGQYLPTGSFIIRGKRNFIKPQPLIMGISLLFRVQRKQIFNILNHDKQDDDEQDNVTQQFIDSGGGGGGGDNDKSIYITKTMIQSNPKQKKKIQTNNNQKNKKNKTDKKLAKYGFDNNNNDDPNLLNKKEKTKRKKRSKYNKIYDAKDRKLVEQLLGIKNQKDQIKQKIQQREKEINEEKEKQQQKQEPKDGYNLNEIKKKNIIDDDDENIDQQNNEQQNNEQQEEEKKEEKERKHQISSTLSSEISLLTGKLDENDVILYCMTMCGPYSCLINREFEYKIKIQPGNNKRGSAIKYVYDIFQNLIKNSSKLNEKLDILTLFNNVQETEINHIFLSNTKITPPQSYEAKTFKQKQKQIQKDKLKQKQKRQQKQSNNNNNNNNKKRKKK